MASYGLQQSVGRVRHVAVVTAAAAGLCLVAGMLFDVLLGFLVALQASLVPIHVRRQLIIRVAVVHGMARNARELTALIAR